MKSQNVLILSCNTGEGHNSCAKALKKVMESENMKCDIFDALSIVGEWYSKLVSVLYGFSVTTSLFGLVYRISEWYSSLSKKLKSIVYHINRIYADKLLRIIQDNRYDAVVSTHPFPAETMTHLRNKRNLEIPAFFIATDYTCYPFLNETDLDGYMIAHQELVDEYIMKGVPEKRLYVTGIPVDKTKFTDKITRHEAREIISNEYKWKKQSSSGKWFMIMGGSMGFGDMNKLLKYLLEKCCHDDVIICLCGKNEKQRKKLEKKYQYSDVVKVVGFTDKVHLIMDACDVLFTKPGGLTSTEALNRNIPIIHTLPIKGVEDKNAMFFHDRNMSFSSNDIQSQTEYAFMLCEDEYCREKMMKAQRNNRIEDSCERIIDIINGSLIKQNAI